MEAGFFARSIKNGHREIECPDPKIDEEAQAKLQKFFGPIRMVLQFVQNEFISSIFEAVDSIVMAVFSITAIFNKYDGSLHCKGFLFGVTGTNFILNMGHDIISRWDIDAFNDFMGKDDSSESTNADADDDDE